MAVAEENWSNLPGELVEKVAEFVTSSGDYIRARAVCLSWLSALPKTPKHLPTQFPLLMLPGGTDTHMVLFSLAETKSYCLEFPSEIHFNSICGSCHGWLVIENGNSSLSLFNPFTKAYIDLPSLGLRPGVFDHQFKFVLSSSPSSSDFMAIASLRYSARLLFYRCGDKRWTDVDLLPARILQPFADVIFYKQNQVVALRRDGEILIMDITRDDKNSSTEIKTKQILRPQYLNLYLDLYLVESEDKFLIIRKFRDYRDKYRVTILFTVYRLEWNKSRTGVIEAKWCEVNRLDNKMIFLGMGPCSYFCSSDFQGCRGNCLYFAEDFTYIAKFDLGDKRTKPLPCCPQEELCVFPPAIWLTPSPV